MNIPSTLRAGDTLNWTDEPGDHPAPAWTMKYALRAHGLAPITLTGAASGASHAFTVTAAVSALYAAGEYQWAAFAEQGAVRMTIATGYVTILPDLAAATETTDTRTHNEKMLAGITAVLEGRASKAESMLTIGGKSISFLKPAELTEWQTYYEGKVKAERAAVQGSGPVNVVRVQFGG